MLVSQISRITRGVVRRAHNGLVDERFDRQWQVDTYEPKQWSPSGDGIRGPGNYAYGSSPARSFLHAINSLEIDAREFTFVDLGSGKGRTLLIASSLPFLRVEGVEFSEELHRIALTNIRRFAGQKRSPIVAHCLDAKEYVIPSGPCLFYLYNPFGEAVISRVLDNIRASWLECPRPIYFVYMNPMKRYLFDESDFLEIAPRAPFAWAKDWLLSPHKLAFYRTASTVSKPGNSAREIGSRG